MSVLTIVQVRVGSTRLPGKALLPIGGKPMFQYVVDAAPMPMIVACPTTDFAIMDICRDLKVPFACFSPPDDVLGRFVWAHQLATDHYEQEFSHILRLTADCPMLTQELAWKMIRACTDFDPRDELYSSVIYTNRPHDPDGFDMEIFPAKQMLLANDEVTDPFDREHVTPWFYSNLDVVRMRVSELDPKVKISVDTQDEYLLVKSIMEGRVK